MSILFSETKSFSGPSDYSGIPKVNLPVTAPGSAKYNFSGGTNTQTNTLESLRVAQGTPIEYDRDLLVGQIAMLLEAHNHLVAEQLSMLCNFSSERFVRIGATDSVEMRELDLAALPTAQKVYHLGSNQGWPLRRFGIGTQWNHEYWSQKDMRTFAEQMQAILVADKKLIASRIRKALFTATGYTFNDRFKDDMPLPVKPLLNADGVAIPPNPYGIQFNNSAHTHYMYCGGGNGDTVTDAGGTAWNNASTVASKGQNLTAMLNNLREHYSEGSNKFLVSTTEAAFFAPINGAATQIVGFQKLEYTYIKPSVNRDIVQGEGFYNPENSYDRLIGMFDGCEVWVKPWMPAGYILLYNEGAPKPLQVRVWDGGKAPGNTVNGSATAGAGDLRMVYEYQPFPLYAQAMVRDFDVAASTERQNGCILDCNHADSYHSPSYP